MPSTINTLQARSLSTTRTASGSRWRIPGRAKPSARCSRACLEELPASKALISRFRAVASGPLACQKILKTQGLSHDTRTKCEPLIDAIPSAAVRREFTAYLDFQLETAKTLGLGHV